MARPAEARWPSLRAKAGRDYHGDLMTRSTRFTAALLLVLLAGTAAGAQPSRQLRARLAPVPLDVLMQARIAGSGSVTATLTGTALTLTGTFKDLKSPATIVQLHRSPNKGLRGPAIADITATKDLSGTISGTLTLTADQAADAANGLLYVQLHSEKAADGNLWGWLLPQEGKK